MTEIRFGRDDSTLRALRTDRIVQAAGEGFDDGIFVIRERERSRFLYGIARQHRKDKH